MEEIKETVIDFITGAKDRVKKNSKEIMVGLNDMRKELNDDMANLGRELNGNGTDPRV